MPAPDHHRDAIADLHDLRAALAAIEARVVALEAGRRKLRATDRRLLVAIRDVIGEGMAFTSCGVLQAADEDPRLHAALSDCKLDDATCLGRRLGALRRGRWLDFVKRDESGVWLTLAAPGASERHEDA